MAQIASIRAANYWCWRCDSASAPDATAVKRADSKQEPEWPLRSLILATARCPPDLPIAAEIGRLHISGRLQLAADCELY